MEANGIRNELDRSGDDIAQLRARIAASEGEAAYLSAVLTAACAGTAADLEEALRHLQQAAARGHRAAQTQLAALAGNWRLADDISAGTIQRPETWERLRAAVDVASWLSVPFGQMLSAAPRIAMVQGYVAPAACDWLIGLGRPHLKPAQIFDRDEGGLRYDDSRNNSAAELSLARADCVLAFVRARIAALAEVPVLSLELSQVLHYEVGQQFGPHYDFLNVKFPGLAREAELRGQRALTLLIYLNDDYEGGETAFPALGRSFKGRKGDALVFWNITEAGALDWRTQHVGTAPTRGEKWLFSQWIRVRAA